MSVTVYKVPRFASGSISFGALRTSFKESSSGQIKASQLLRNASTSATNPIIPDCTENEAVSSSSNWKTSQLRNIIKEYSLIQTGTDLNFDIDTQDWNGNLGRTIRKNVFLTGTCGSNDATSPAVSLDATAYNLTIYAQGSILGAAGRGGGTGSGAPDISGQTGGNAMTIVSRGNQVNVNVTYYAKVYSGGGGGERGRTGATGSNGRCRETTRSQSGCQQGNTASCPGGWNQYNSGQWCCEWRRGCNANIWWKECERYYSTSGGAGGAGGTGGLGRGYNNQSGSLAGVAGSAGGSGGGCGAGNGGNGENGGSGGEWGSSGTGTGNSGGGGSNGAAVAGLNFIVTGDITSSSVKGNYR